MPRRYLLIQGLCSARYPAIFTLPYRRLIAGRGGVMFEELNLHALMAGLLANAAGGEIGDAGAAAYKAAIKAGGGCDNACKAAIDAAAETAKKVIDDA
ncbi:MAG: hypothetical protein ACLP9L_41775 [Thermoguttaceae bacterium]